MEVQKSAWIISAMNKRHGQYICPHSLNSTVTDTCCSVTSEQATFTMYISTWPQRPQLAFQLDVRDRQNESITSIKLG